MNFILKGDPKEVAKVLQENRIRVDRGVISFTPCQPETALDEDAIATLREDLDAKTQMCSEMADSQIEMAKLTKEIVVNVAESGHSIPDDLIERLSKFGVDVPKKAETVPNTADTAENAGESAPVTVPIDPEADGDDKTVVAEDMTEVNLDDVKDIPEADTKEEPATTPKKKRAKKSE